MNAWTHYADNYAWFSGWPLWLGLVAIYYIMVSAVILNGHTRQLLGHKEHEDHKHLHRVLWQWHTGLAIDPRRSHGDERRLRRTAQSTTRATPEGAQIYWSRLSRKKRAGIRNLISVGVITFGYGLTLHTVITVQAITAGIITGIWILVILIIRRLRARHAERPVIKIETTREEPTMFVAGGEVVESKPQLDGSVPKRVLALLISDTLGTSADEAMSLLTLGPDQGELKLPDHFAALEKQRQVIEEIVRAQNSATLRFTWVTNRTPRLATWIPVLNQLPSRVIFRDFLPQLEKLKKGEFGVGMTMSRGLYITSHNGDTPWHVRSMDSGTGKSTGFQVKAAQILHNDPTADLYCWDTKQVSFEPLVGIPGVTVYNNPVTEMNRMWEGFYALTRIMDDRYTAVREKRNRYEDFNDIWILVDEGNDLGSQLKSYYDKYIKKSGMPTQPIVWIDAISRLVYLGRQVGIRGEMMFQNMTDKALGGVSLRDAFQIKGMAGYGRNQWMRIVGSTPVPELRKGPGKIMMVNGPDQQWVQGFYDDPDYLRAYALAGREERMAS